MRMFGRMLLASAALISGAGQAWAEDATPAPARDATATAGNETGDIVVTARRREESLQNVPIAVTAVSGAALAKTGATDIANIQAVAPSLTITTQGTSRTAFALSLRGQRTNEAQLLTDQPVGAYFAEVLQARSIGFASSLYDIQSVQVLKGVQGTLFGRNMTGGAVLVEPNRPTDKLAAEVVAQVGNYKMHDVYGMLNIPLADWASLRVAGKTRERKGYTTDVSDGRDYDDQNYDTFRASLRLTPGGGIESTTIFDWLRSRIHGSALYPTAINPAAPAIGAYAYFRSLGLNVADPVAQFARQQTLGRQQFDQGFGDGGNLDAYGFKPYEYSKNWGVTNRTIIPVGDLTLKNVFGYRKVEYASFQDLDGVPAFLINSAQTRNIEQYSEEFQVQGKALDNRLNFIAGIYYFLEQGSDGSTSQQFPELALVSQGLPLTTPAVLFRNALGGTGRAEAVAGYLAGTYKFSDKFQLSAGGRYTTDKRSATVSPQLPALGVCLYRRPDGTSFPFAQCTHSNSNTWNAFTWDVTLQYQPLDALTAYISTRKGFRAGGFSLRATSDAELAPFNPEKVQEYELGLKTRTDLGGARLTTATALFFQNYRNVQKQQAGIDGGGNVTTIISNTAAQHNYGAEFDAGLHSGPFDMTLSYAYVNIDITKGLQPFEHELVGAPQHQVGVTLNYATPLAGLGDLNLNASMSYRSKIWLDLNDDQSLQKGYALVNLRASLGNIKGTGIGAAAFVNNLTDQFYRVGVIGIYREAGYISSTYGEPRTYGLELSYKF